MTEPDTVLDEITSATARLLATCRTFTDADLAVPSRCPGWSRGHVLAHVARNADSLVNLLTWARTGVETPQYASAAARDADIEAGAGRPVTEQLADLESSARRLHETATAMPPNSWHAVVRGRGGAEIVARDLPWRRLCEVEIHHFDLDAGYSASRWPESFVARLLPESVADVARAPGVPSVRLVAPGVESVLGDGEPAVTVSGAGHELAAWLIGRTDGTTLTVDPAGALPRLPGWR